jgi:hypothetical protein
MTMRLQRFDRNEDGSVVLYLEGAPGPAVSALLTREDMEVLSGVYKLQVWRDRGDGEWWNWRDATAADLATARTSRGLFWLDDASEPYFDTAGRRRPGHRIAQVLGPDGVQIRKPRVKPGG